LTRTIESQTADASFSDFGTGDVSPSNGFHCNGHGNGHVKSNGNGHVKSNRNGHVKSNRNGRCAKRQGQRQLSLRGHSGRIVPAQRRACFKTAHTH
jgi:hypothetical protein